MIVVVDEHLFEEGGARTVDLVALLRLIGLRGHGLLTRSEPRPNARPSIPDPVADWCNGLR
jgi:hypothetical protein